LVLRSVGKFGCLTRSTSLTPLVFAFIVKRFRVFRATSTTLVFTLANATLLTVRLRVENSVLGYI
ncbi:hypothetical protein ABLN86_19490, partial [Mycobacterium tuberculosis]